MFCPSCGTQMPQGVAVCASCGWRESPAPTTSPPSIENDPAMRMLLPIGRSPYAIVAGYLGLVSVIILPAPLALIFGLLALRDIKRNPETGGKGRAIFGIVMGAIFSVIFLGLVIGALASRA